MACVRRLLLLMMLLMLLRAPRAGAATAVCRAPPHLTLARAGVPNHVHEVNALLLLRLQLRRCRRSAGARRIRVIGGFRCGETRAERGRRGRRSDIDGGASA